MLRVHIRRGTVGDDVVVREVPWRAGVTAREVARGCADLLPGREVEVLLNGGLLGDQDYDEPLRDGDDLVVVAATTYGVDIVGAIVYAIVAAIVSVGVNYAIQALSPKRRAPDDPQDRGDERSATYSWQGIRTNYGQGLIVPAVYGRIATGGQAIETSAFARSQGGSSALAVTTDTLRVVLALSEGRIHRIGDRLANAVDRLGGLGQATLPVGGGTPIPGADPSALPNFVRVNDSELATVVEGYSAIAFTWSGGWIGNPAELSVGDLAFLYNPSTGTQYGYTEVVAVANESNGAPSPFLKEWPASWNAVLTLGATNTTGLEIAFGDFVGGVFTSRFARVFTTSQERFFQKPSAGVELSIRPGELTQSPLSAPFSNVSTSYGVNEALDGYGVERTFSVTGAEQIRTVTFLVEAQAGLYTLSATGENEPLDVELRIGWRYVGETDWRQFTPVPDPSINLQPDGQTFVFAPDFNDVASPQAKTLPVQFDAPVSGDIEFRMQRRTGTPQSGAGLVTWRALTTGIEHQLAYPRVALAAFNLQASSKWSGGLPQFKVRTDGIQVRVWDAENGFSERCWDVPASPFDWHTYPPGRNPAWILLDFLTQPWGLGQYVDDDDLDLPAFAAWAVWCDRDPNPGAPWGEPQFTCDLVIDESRPAWEWVLAICEAGRAAPVFKNGKISIVYEYAAAHAQGSVDVPAKAPTQLFSTSNVTDLSVTWLPRATRPTAYMFQFLNEEQFWQQDVFPVQDPTSTLDDPTEPDELVERYRPEQAQIYSVTRPTQVYREGIYRHRVNRLVTRRIDFVTGRWALAAEVGDLIDVEHDTLRPFGTDVPVKCAVMADASSSTSVTVDHDLRSGPWDAVVFRDGDGEPVHAGINSMTGTTVDGRPATILTLDTAVTVDAGAVAVVGMDEKLVETYRITAIEMREDFTHAITALEWVPEVYDDIAPGDYSDGFAGGSDFAVEADEGGKESPIPTSITITKVENGHRITFAKPPERRAQTARVFLRGSDDDRWAAAGATDGNAVDVRGLRSGSTVQVSVVIDSLEGDADRPAEAGERATLTVPEWLPLTVPAVTNVRELVTEDRTEWRWSAVTGAVAYEIRAGEAWAGAPVVARVAEPRIAWDRPPVVDVFHIVAVATDGRQGNPTRFEPTAFTPGTAYVDVDDTWAGTHSGTEDDGGELTLSGANLEGTYTSPEFDAGADGAYLWRIGIEAADESLETVDDVTDRLSSPELDWRCVDGRDASPARPGVDWDRTVDDVTAALDDLPDNEFVHGRAGHVGSHVLFTLESRFRTEAGSYGAWAEHTDGIRTARYAQWRVRLDRESTYHSPRVRLARIEARL